MMLVSVLILMECEFTNSTRFNGYVEFFRQHTCGRMRQNIRHLWWRDKIKLRQTTFGFYDSSNAGTLCKSMETDGNMDCSIQGRQCENWNGDNDDEWTILF